MITYKVEGLTELMAKFTSHKFIPANKIDKIVHNVSMKVVENLKANYEAGGHRKTGKLIDSIESFKRKRGSEPFFTYYVGPTYGGGGNAAYILEFGTEPRYKANKKAGGRSIGKRIYGERTETGQVKAYGVIRRTIDQTREQMIEFLKSDLFEMIMKQAEDIGLNTKNK